MKLVHNYLGNIAKSTVYATSEVFKTNIMPNVSEFVDANKNVFVSTYASIRNPKQVIKKPINAMMDSKIYKAVDYGAKNLFEDLRTGKFYNKERDEESQLKAMGSVGDFNDWDDIDISISSDNKDANIVTDGDKKIIESIEGTTASSTKATAMAIAAATDTTVKNGRMNTSILYNQNERLFGGLHNDMSILNATMDSMLKLSHSTLGNMDKNMSDYFTQSLKLDTERNAMIKEMLEMQRNMYTSAVEREKQASANTRNKKRWSDISTSNGMINFEEYGSVIVKNVENQLKNSTGVSLDMFGEDSNILMSFMGSPLKGIMTGLVKGLIPTTTKIAARELDKTISSAFGAFIGKVASAKRNDSNSIFGRLANFLGINTGYNKNIDTGKYHKGPVPFDGITRKAIIDVIPAHLRRIEAALTGKEESFFDYNTGKWVTKRNVKKQFESYESSAISSATSDLREAMNPSIKKSKASLTTREDIDSFERAENQFYKYLFEVNGDFNPNLSAEKNGINMSNYPDLYKYYKIFVQMYKNFDRVSYGSGKNKKTRNTKNSIRLALSKNALDAKENLEKTYRQMEIDSGVFAQYFASGVDSKYEAGGVWRNDSKGKESFKAYNLLKDTKDENGFTIFNYLNSLQQELQWQREAGFQNLQDILLFAGGIGYGGSNIKGSGNNSSYLRNTVRSSLRGSSLSGTIRANGYGDSSANNLRSRIEENERLSAKAISDINSGKAIDIRDFNDQDRNRLLELANEYTSLSEEQYSEELKEAIASGGTFVQWMEKNFWKTNIKNKKDMEKAIEEAEKENKNTFDYRSNEKDEDKKSFLDSIMDKFNTGKNFIANLVSAPAAILENILYTADSAIYNMFFKQEVETDNEDGEHETYHGILDMIAGKTKNAFKNLADRFKEDIWDPLKEYLHIEDEDSFWGKFKSSLSDIGEKAGNAFIKSNKDVYSPLVDKILDVTGIKPSKDAVEERTKNRDQIEKDIIFVESCNNFLDPYFLKLMADYKVNIIEFDTLDTAKPVLLVQLLKALNRNTNKFKEFSSSKQLDMIIKDRINNNDLKSIKDIAKEYGFELNAKTIEDIKPELLRKNILGTNKFKRNMSVSTSGFDKAKYNAAYAISGGFDVNGTLDEMITYLRNMGVSESRLANLKTTEDAIKVFNRVSGLGHVNAFGTFGKPFIGNTMLSKGELLFNSRGISHVNNTGAYSITEPTHILNSYDSSLLMGKRPTSTPMQDLVKENNLKNKIFNNAKGTLKITTGKADINKLKSAALENVPEGLAGAVVGGIASTLLGLVGGPLIGAAVGAGANIVANNNELKDYLFGETDSKGNRKGGLISKQVIDITKKYVPDMFKYGMAGLIPGLLTPLGPVGGLLVGGAIGFLKNNEKFTNKYLGEDGKLGINEQTKNTIDKMLPGILKGAGVGAVVSVLFGGPFGIMGNTVLGSAIGMMASTQEFKELLLGREMKDGSRVGGLAGAARSAFEPLKNAGIDIKNKFIEIIDNDFADPLRRFITPFVHQLPRIASFLPRLLLSGVDKLLSPLGINTERITQNISNGVAKVGKGIVTAPLKALSFVTTKPLGLIGDKLKKMQINDRNASYMTAAQRNEFRASNGMKADTFDVILDSIGKKNGLSVRSARELSNLISRSYQTVSDIKSAKKRIAKQIKDILNDWRTADGSMLSDKAIKEISKSLNTDNPEGIAAIKAIISNSTLKSSDGKYNRGISKEEYESLIKTSGLENLIKKYIELNIKEKDLENHNTKADRDSSRSKLTKLLKDMGVKNADKLSMRKLLDIKDEIDTEVIDAENRDQRSKEEAQEIMQLEKLTNMDEGISSIDKSIKYISEILTAVISGDTSAISNFKDLQNQFSANADNAAYGKFNMRKNEFINKYGKEAFDNLTPEQQDSLTSSSRNILNKRKSNRMNGDLIDLLKGRGNLDEIGIATDNGKRRDIIREQLKYDIDKDTLSYIYNLNKVEFGRLVSLLNRSIIKYYIQKKPLTIEDIDFICSLNKNDQKEFANKCKRMKKAGYTPDQFNSVKDLYELDETAILAAEINAQAGIATNGLGTFLLNGVKSIGSALFKNRDKEESTGKRSKLSAIAGLLNANTNTTPINAIGAGGSLEGSDIDKKGDNKSKHVMDDGSVVTIETKSDGSTELDSADNATKAFINKVSAKEKLQEKMANAQIKLNDMFNKVFGEQEVQGSAKKLKWWEVLLGAMVAAPIIKPLIENIAKPVYENILKPLWKEVVLPGLEVLWNETIKPTLKSALDNIYDAISGDNRDNSGTSNELDPTKLDESVRFYDKDGNVYTVEQAMNANVPLFNKNGDSITYDADSGTFLLKDGSPWYGDMARDAVHGVRVGLVGGARAGKVVSAVGKFSKFLKGTGTVGKVLGTGIDIVSSPVKLGSKASNKTFGLIDNILGLAPKTADDVAEATLKTGSKSSLKGGFLAKAKQLIDDAIEKLFKSNIVINKLKKWFSTIGRNTVDDAAIEGVKASIKEGSEQATKEMTEEATEQVVTKAGKSIAGKIVGIAFAVYDFIRGCDAAESMLGVLEADPLETFICGVVNCLANLIILPALVPNGISTMCKWIVKAIDPNAKLQERQNEVSEIVDEYNALTGENLSETEYLDKYKSTYTHPVEYFIQHPIKATMDYTIAGFAKYLVKDGAGGILNNLKNAPKKFATLWQGGSWTQSDEEWNAIKEFNDKYDQSEYSKPTGGGHSIDGKGSFGRGYAKQIDPAIANARYNKSGDSEYQTIGNSGCGPAAAVNAVKAAYGMGNDVLNAANYALSRGYKETNGGTLPGFFGDYFARNGLSSQTTSNKNQLLNNIAAGNPTVLMGQDTRGVSNRTPYGKVAHYVTATGVDSKGNIIVQDPESRYDNQLYRASDLLNKTSFGVSARGKYGRGVMPLFGRGNTLRGSCLNEQAYNFFIDNGWSAAAAAGAVGNIMVETGVDANGQLILDAKEDNGGGIGIVQWTYKALKDEFKQFAASRGEPWPNTGLKVQLECLLMQLPGNWNFRTNYYSYDQACKMTFQQFTQCTDPVIAAGAFCSSFENPSIPHLDRRQNYAVQIYNQYSGNKASNYVPSSTSDNTTGTSGTTTESKGILSDFFTNVSNIFTDIPAAKALGVLANGFVSPLYEKLFGSKSSEDNSSSGYTSSDGGSAVNNTGNGYASDLIASAAGEIGYKEGPNSANKYGDWYGNPNQHWCAQFVSWNANQAGIPETVIPKYQKCTVGYKWFMDKNQLVSNPANAQPGDLAFFTDSGPDGIYHTGIVEDVSNNEVHTIEGNTSDMVARRSYATTNSKLLITRPIYPKKSSSSSTSSSTQYASVGDINYNQTRGGNGIKPLSRYGQFHNSLYGKGSYNTKRIPMQDSHGKMMYAEIDRDEYRNPNIGVHGKGSYGRGTVVNNYDRLLTVIIETLVTIADNTDKLNTIVALLNSKLGVDIKSSDVSTSPSSLKSKLKNALMGKDTINYNSANTIINVMNALAAE